MPWNKTNFPNSMKNLPAAVRNKAIEIANAMLEEKHTDEGITIATAISRAKDWAANRGKPIETTNRGRKTDVKQHGEDRFVSPAEGGWQVKKEGGKATQKFHRKTEAVRAAKKEAKRKNASVTIKNSHGKIEDRISYNPRNTHRQNNSSTNRE
ncbi:MAG: DUF2188 domain-containing protein [Candidatus Dadabacteria bacterium]